MYARLMVQTSQSDPATATARVRGPLEIMPREMLECAQPPPITTHNIIHTHTLIQGDHKQPSMPSTTSTTTLHNNKKQGKQSNLSQS